MDKRKLPIGIQTFRCIREENRYYVDKTGYAARLAEEGGHYFLSRPRRFGKSLFVDTLKELFEGSEELFRGLAVHDRWDWSVRCPVLRLDFSGRDFETPEDVHRNVMAQLDEIERRRGIATGYDTAPERLSRLIEALREQDEHGRRVVVLVDEYDKPILDALDSRASAIANRNYLRSLYGAIKHRDADIRFSFLTGVSKFSKTNPFSTLNIHADLTLHPRYSAICGYTDADLERVFAPELTGFDRDRIRKWYNGYGWLGEETVYNPYDVLHLFYRGRFGNYWIDSGTPKFVPEMLAQRHVLSAELDALWASESLLSSFEVGNIATEALLFQTGYLTIVGEEERYGQAHYRLGCAEPGGSAQPERHAARCADGESAATGNADQRPRRDAAQKRLRRNADGIPAGVRQHPVPAACEEGSVEIRGVLCQRGVLPPACAGRRRGAGGQFKRGPGGLGGATWWRHIPVRVQDGGR